MRNKELDVPPPVDPVYEVDNGEKRAPEIPIYNQVELASETDFSIGSILRGTAAKPLNAFEKKAALINAELDRFGLGRYQICVWFLCGFGYFLDLAWAQGVGLIASAVYQEMNVPDASTGSIWSCANAGLAVGALFWGIMVDIIGRKWAFNLTCLITSVFGLLLVSNFVRLKTVADLERLPPSTTMAPSAESTFWHLWASAEISRSMRQSPWNSCHKIVETLSPSSRYGNPSVLSWPLPSHTEQLRNGDAILLCPRATPLLMAKLVAKFLRTWDGATKSSCLVS